MNDNLNWYNILILVAALQGLFLFFAIYRIDKSKERSNNFLAIFILFASIALIGRYFYTHNYFSLIEQKLLFSGDLIIFTFGPLLYLYFLQLFSISNKTPKFIHFIPVSLFILFLIPAMLSNKTEYINYIRKFSFTFIYWEIFAIAVNMLYLVLNWEILKQFVKNTESDLSYLPQVKFYKTLLIIILVSLISWIISFIFVELGQGNYIGYHLVWIVLSGSLLALGYYSIKKPEVFTIPVIKREQIIINKNDSELDEIAEKVVNIMQNEKPYLDPKLTLSKLAEKLDISSHLLSKVINESFNKNFFHFVNDYRVEEFKKLVQNNHDKNYTLLAIAYDSGFNSKTTFNSAFKKITNLTPKEFLNQSKN